MPLGPGTRLGPYEIHAAIGAGGMGEIYRARDSRLERTVAIKVLPEHVAGDPELRQRFEREAKIVSSLNHPHICTLHDIGSQDGIDYLVMEYLEGETLADRLGKGALPLNDALKIAIEIAGALDKAHRQGITHRDLKPGNVMLTKAGAKLLDFGLAKAGALVVAGAGLSALPTTPANLTAHGTILGTFQYMAPEQLEGKDADARTDIFAFGALLYEMLTGKKAFEGKSQASLIAAIMHTDPPSISTIQPLASRPLDRIVQKCLAKDPDARWQTARDLVDELKWAAESEAQPRDAALVAARRKDRERLAWLLFGGAALLVAILAVPATRSFRGTSSEPLVTRLDVVTPPTTSPSSFALSPDGRQLAFVANGESGSQLWVRPLDQVNARPLAGTQGATYPFWSPDGRAVGFFADAKLKRIGIAGGAPEIVADAPSARGATWSPEGVIVFAPIVAGGLVQVNATGGTPMPVTRRGAGQAGHRWPRFLPDGRRFLFLVLNEDSSAAGIYVGSLDGGEPVRVLASETQAAYVAPGYLLLLSQGVLVAHRFDVARGTVSGDPIPVAPSVGLQANGLGAFSVSATGVLAHRTNGESRRQLAWLDRTGKVTGNLGPAEDTVPSEPSLAPNGQRLAVSRWVQGNIDVWLIDVAGGLPLRLTFDPGADMAPVWSPDGSRIVFMSSRNGNFDLFEKSATGAGDEQALLVNGQDKSPRDWSPDGRFLLYAEQGEKTASDLWVLPLTGERTPIPVAQTTFDEGQGQFSPDGRWLAYASNETGRSEIYVRPFPASGGKWQVSIGGGIYPRWRRDGKELFYIAPDNKLMAVAIQADPQTGTLLPGASVALFATRTVVSGTNVFSGGPYSAAQYVPATDGRFLMNVDAADTAASPINVVLNWTTGLKN